MNVPLIHSLILTLEVMAIAAVGSVLVGGIFAWGACWAFRWTRVLGLIAMGMAAALPLYIHASGWEATWGKFGWLPMVQASVRGWSISGLAATAWIHAMAGAAGSALILYWSLSRWPRGLLEAAMLETSPIVAYWRVGLPLLSPAIFAAGGWSALLVATDMTVADLYSLRTLPDIVYQQFAIAPTMLPATIATGITMSILIMLVLRIRKNSQASFAIDFPSATNVYRPRWQMALASATTAGVALLVLGVPVLSLIIKAGWSAELSEQGVMPRFSLMTAWETVTDAAPRFQEELSWTGALTGLVVVFTLPLSIAASWLCQRSQRWSWLTGVSLATLATLPGPVLALAVVWLFSQSWVPGSEWLYQQTLLPTVLAALPRPVAICTGMITAGRLLMPFGVSEAASVDGASLWTRLLRIELPLMIGPLMLSALLAALLAIGDLSASLLVAPPDVQTVAVRMFGLLHSGVRRQEAGLCLITLIAEFVLVSAAALVIRSLPRRFST